jgi:hypothetical protein
MIFNTQKIKLIPIKNIVPYLTDRERLLFNVLKKHEDMPENDASENQAKLAYFIECSEIYPEIKFGKWSFEKGEITQAFDLISKARARALAEAFLKNSKLSVKVFESFWGEYTAITWSNARSEFELNAQYQMVCLTDRTVFNVRDADEDKLEGWCHYLHFMVAWNEQAPENQKMILNHAQR